MGVISNLVVKITAETAGLRAGLADVNESVQGFATRAQGFLGAIEFQRFAAELGESVQQTGELASHIQDLAEKSGLSAEAVQALDFAAKQSGSSFDSISVGLGILSKHLTNIGTDTAAQKALKDLGISANDLKGMSLDQVFIKIGEGVRNSTDPVRTFNDVLVLLGRSGGQNIPTLKSDLAGLTQEAHDMGLVMSNELIAKGDQLNDTWTAMLAKTEALKAEGLSPLFEAFLGLPGPMQEAYVVGAQFAPMLGSMAIALTAVAPLVGGMAIALSGLAAVLAAPFVIHFAVEGLTQANKQMIDAGVMVSAEGMVMPLDNGRKKPTDINLSGGGGFLMEGSKFADIPMAASESLDKLTQQKPKLDEFEQSVRSLTQTLGASAINSANQWSEAVKRIGGEEKLTTDELRRYHDVLTAAADKMKLLGQEAPAYWRAIAAGQHEAKLAAETTGFLGGQLGQAVKAGSPQLFIPTIENPQTRDLLNNPANVPGAGVQTGETIRTGETWASQFMVGAKGTLQQMPQVIMNALQGGGSVSKSLGATFGGNIVESLGGKLTSGLSGMFGKTIGGALGSVVPGLGTMLGSMIGPMIGKLAGKIWGGIQGIFGNDEEARQVNPARDAFMSKFQSQFGGNRNDATIKALEAAGLGGERAAGLMSMLNAADTMAEFNAAKSAIENALAGANDKLKDATSASDTFNVSLTGSDDAIKQLGETESKVAETMLKGFQSLVDKLDQMIARLSLAGSLASGVIGAGAAIAAQSPSGVPTFATPSEFIGSSPSPQDVGVTSGAQVTIQAGTIVGNPDELAYMMIDALEGGGDVASDYRAVHNQVMES